MEELVLMRVAKINSKQERYSKEFYELVAISNKLNRKMEQMTSELVKLIEKSI